MPEDIAELKPTLFVGVPRVFDRLTAGQLELFNRNSTFMLVDMKVEYSIDMLSCFSLKFLRSSECCV